MLDDLLSNKRIKASATIGFWKCNSTGDDIEVYGDQKEVLGHFRTLRQQEQNEQNLYMALSDFIAPKETERDDFIGGFACTAGIGQEELIAKYQSDHDEFNILLLKALTDRLAEALAEQLHVIVRKQYWGYSPNESLSVKDVINVEYQGIRPACGYPTQPDHTEK